MSNKELLEIEEVIKEFDPSYETKIVKPGSVIEAFTEDSNGLKGNYYYVCKEGEEEAPEKSGLKPCIKYRGYEKYFKDAIIDSKIEVGNMIFSINEIYDSVDDFINRELADDVVVDTGTIVDVDYDGHNFIYYIVDSGSKVLVPDGLCVINTNALIYHEIKGKKAGDCCSIDNKVIINQVYRNLDDYNLKNELNTVMNNTIVDVTIDNIPFTLYISDTTKKERDFETVSLVTPLGMSLLNKKEGSKFTYSVGGIQFNGVINKVYNSKKKYNNSQDNVKKLS